MIILGITKKKKTCSCCQSSNLDYTIVVRTVDSDYASPTDIRYLSLNCAINEAKATGYPVPQIIEIEDIHSIRQSASSFDDFRKKAIKRGYSGLVEKRITTDNTIYRIWRWLNIVVSEHELTIS